MGNETLDEVQKKIIDICRTRVPLATSIGPETSLVRDLGLDSLQALEVISDIETQFQVSVPSESLPEIDSLADLAEIIFNQYLKKTQT